MNEKKTTPKPPKVKVPWGERLSNYACPMVLGGVVCATLMYTLYRPYTALYTILFVAAEFLLFMFFDKLKTKKYFGGFIYTIIMVIVLFFSMYLMFAGAMSYGFMAPMNWFYGEEGSFSYQPFTLNATFLGGGFFIISILYYFTQIRYRSLGVMLCMLFPFVIYAKRADEMPEILVTLMITAFLAVLVHNKRIDPAIERDKRGRLIINRAYIISVAIFVSVTGAITMMLDKPTYRSKLEQNSNYFDVYQTQGTGSGDGEDLSDQSSGRQGGLNYTYNPMFYLDTDGTNYEYFLRRQCYNVFNGDRWTSTLDDYDNVYSSVIPEYDVDDILADMQTLMANPSFRENLCYKWEKEENKEIFMNYEMPETDTLIEKHHMHVYDENFSPVYLPAPLHTITDMAEFSALEYRKYPVSTIIRSAAWRSRDSVPLDDSFDFWQIDDGEMAKYLNYLNIDTMRFYNVLSWCADEDTYAYIFGEDSREEFELRSQNVENVTDEQRAAAIRLVEDFIDNVNNYENDSHISERIRALAEELTEGCESDVEKADAILNYFADGFYYSLEYVPEDDSIEYFIFESKTGYCTSFATAYTLLARAAGLTARYVEGFAAFERQDDGSIVVRDGHAHAFVEVYIPGGGWITYDPTLGEYMDTPTPQESNFNAAMFLRIMSRFLIVIIVGFVVIFVLLFDRIKELILRVRLRFKPTRERVLLLYANLYTLINFSTKEDYSAYTVKMLRRYLNETRACCPELLLRMFERVAFAGYTPTEEEWKEIYLEYKHCYKFLRKIPSPKRMAKMAAV